MTRPYGALNHERLIEFLQALVRQGKRRRKKVFLILDKLGVHHCKPVKAWLAEHQRDIKAFFLPSYSPQLNPDEHMQFIAANRDRVRSYFQDPIVKYAASRLHRAGSIGVPKQALSSWVRLAEKGALQGAGERAGSNFRRTWMNRLASTIASKCFQANTALAKLRGRPMLNRKTLAQNKRLN